MDTRVRPLKQTDIPAASWRTEYALVSHVEGSPRKDVEGSPRKERPSQQTRRPGVTHDPASQCILMQQHLGFSHTSLSETPRKGSSGSDKLGFRTYEGDAPPWPLMSTRVTKQAPPILFSTPWPSEHLCISKQPLFFNLEPWLCWRSLGEPFAVGKYGSPNKVNPVL